MKNNFLKVLLITMLIFAFCINYASASEPISNVTTAKLSIPDYEPSVCDVQVGQELSEEKNKFKMWISFQNNTDSDIVIKHYTGEKFIYVLYNKKKLIWQSSYSYLNKPFFESTTKIVSGYGSPRVFFNYYLDLKDKATRDAFNKADRFAVFINGESKDFYINQKGYSSLILKPEDPEQSQNSAEVKTNYEIINNILIMKLNITNKSKNNITIKHFYPDAKKYNFVLYDANNKNLLQRGDYKKYLQTTAIKPGETIQIKELLNLNISYNRSIFNKAVKFKAFINGTTTDFNIDSNGYSCTIKHVPGELIEASGEYLIVKFKPNTNYVAVKYFLDQLKITSSPSVGSMYWILKLPSHINTKTGLDILKNHPDVESVEMSNKWWNYLDEEYMQ